MRISKGYLFRAYCSKGVRHPHLCFGRGSKAGSRPGKLQSGRKGRLQMHPDWRLLVWRSWKPAHQKQGVSCDSLGEHICLSPIGPKSEAERNITEAVSYLSSPDHSGPIAIGIVVWLPGLVASDSGSEFYFYI